MSDFNGPSTEMRRVIENRCEIRRLEVENSYLQKCINSLHTEIERKDAVMRLVLDVLLYHRDDPDMIEWAEGKVLRTVSTEESIDDS